MKWLLLAVLLILGGCTSQRRCLRRYPPWERTVTVRDTVVVTPPARRDTVWRAQPQDTLVLEKERVRVRIERRWDTLRIEAACAPETLRIPQVREVIRLVPAPQPRPGLPGWVWAAVVGLGLLLWRLLR